MTAFLRSQLDRTRQPGYAQADASWCAPVGVAAIAGSSGNLLETTTKLNGRDSRPRRTTGAADGLGRRAP